MNDHGQAMRHQAHSGKAFNASLSEQPAITEYLLTLRKYFRPIAVFTVVVTALAALYAFTATPIYRSTATLLLEEQGANLVSIEELYGIDTSDAGYSETQFQALRSRELAQRVIERLGLWQDAELVVESDVDREAPAADAGDLQGQRHREKVISAFLRQLNIAPVRNTRLVNISFQSPDPVRATLVANTMGEEYIQNVLDVKLALTSTASSWLDERLAVLRTDVDEAERRLIAFQRENNLIDIQGNVGRLSEQQLLLFATELAQARSELAAARDLYDDVNALRDTPALLNTMPAVRADALVQRTDIDQGNVQRELDELLTRYGARHPLVLDKKSELASLADTLQRHVERAADTIVKNYRVAQQRVSAIEAKLSDSRSEIQLIGDKRFELDSLQREVATRRDVYDQYFSRITEAASKDGQERANARISDRARIPVDPIKPNKALIIVAAALGALLISVLIAFLREAMDDTIKGTNDVESKLDMKLLGILPMVKSGLMKKSTTLPLNPEKIADRKGVFAEAVNSIRTTLSLNDREAPRKVILVTSSVRGEGKSTLSMNIAYSFGHLERVLLVDCDMRRPSIARTAGLRKNSKGLSDLIMNTATAEQCIKRGRLGGNVDILPCGPIPNQPLELLSSKRFARIIKEVAQYYDRIIIDTAPTQAVSDALVLSRLSDAVVYAVKSHDTPMNLVRRGVTRLHQAGARIEGIVMTQVDVEKMADYCGNYSLEGYSDSAVEYGHADSEEHPHSEIRLTFEETMDIRNDKNAVNLGIDSMYRRTARSADDASRLPGGSARLLSKSERLRIKNMLQAENA